MTMPSMTDVHADTMLGGKRRKKNRLSDLSVDFVSLVKAGDNPSAKVVILKAKKKMMGEDGCDDEPDEDEDDGDKMEKDVLKDASPDVVAYVESLEEAVIKAETERDAAQALVEAASTTDEGDGEGIDLEKVLKGTDPVLAKIIKDQAEAINKANERATAAENIAKAEAEARATLLLKSRVTAQMSHLGEVDAVAGILAKTARGVDAETYTALENLLIEANRGLVSGALFTEIGKTGGNGPTDPLTKLATEIQKAEPTLTWDQAVDKAMDRDPQAYRLSVAGGGA